MALSYSISTPAAGGEIWRNKTLYVHSSCPQQLGYRVRRNWQVCTPRAQDRATIILLLTDIYGRRSSGCGDFSNIPVLSTRHTVILSVRGREHQRLPLTHILEVIDRRLSVNLESNPIIPDRHAVNPPPSTYFYTS